MGHRTRDKPDRASLIWKLSSNELEVPVERNEKDSRNVKAGKKSASHPIITRKESRETEGDGEKGQDRTRKNP